VLLLLVGLAAARALRDGELGGARVALVVAAALVPLWLLRRPARPAPAAPIRGYPVRVAEDRSSDFSERDRGFLRAAYVLEHPDGRRQRVEGSLREPGAPRVDDMGVVYLAGDELVSFVRIPV